MSYPEHGNKNVSSRATINDASIGLESRTAVAGQYKWARIKETAVRAKTAHTHTQRSSVCVLPFVKICKYNLRTAMDARARCRSKDTRAVCMCNMPLGKHFTFFFLALASHVGRIVVWEIDLYDDLCFELYVEHVSWIGTGKSGMMWSVNFWIFTVMFTVRYRYRETRYV